MGRDLPENLDTILPACTRRQTLDLYLADDTALRLSRGAVIRDIDGTPTTYLNQIKSLSEMRYSLEDSIDRVTVVCENITTTLGLNLASNLRLLDYATVKVGKIYQSKINPSLIVDIPDEFVGLVSNGEANETEISFEMITDIEALGSIIASRAFSPRCWWLYQDGINCTASGGPLECPKTRTACIARGVEHEMGGWEFFEDPSANVPGSGGNEGGGIEPPEHPCFVLDTNIWTPRGDVPIGDLPLGKQAEGMPIVSFDPITHEVNYHDEIVEVHEREYTGIFKMTFSTSSLGVTPLHRLFLGFNKFKVADDFSINDNAKAFTKSWVDTPVKNIKWNSDLTVKVRNLTVKKNQTYFANRIAVHNAKPIILLNP